MKKNLWLLIVLGLISVAVAYFYLTQTNKTYSDSFADFSVADTNAVDKIIIADTEGNKIVLKRTKQKWSLNDSLEARPEAVNLILTTFKDVVVQSPIAKTARENVIKRLASTHKMVQIFKDGIDEPHKIWYIGDPTQNHMGTNVLLEIPGKGKAPDPYIVELPYHHGYLTPIFFTDLKEWMQTPIFVYPELDIKSIKVNYFSNPEYSFSIERTGTTYSVRDLSTNNFMPALDTLFLKDYIDHYKGVYYEIADRYLTKEQTDSLLHSKPLCQIAITNNAGKLNEISIFQKNVTVREGELIPIDQADPHRYYGWLNRQKLVIIQRYVFDELLPKKEAFLK